MVEGREPEYLKDDRAVLTDQETYRREFTCTACREWSSSAVSFTKDGKTGKFTNYVQCEHCFTSIILEKKGKQEYLGDIAAQNRDI